LLRFDPFVIVPSIPRSINKDFKFEDLDVVIKADSRAGSLDFDEGEFI
jgi:hypothetical protein